MSYSINELRAWVKSVRLKAKPNSIYLVSAQQVEDKLVQMSHKIAELEKERDIRDLEQQAKGLAEFLLKADKKELVFNSVSDLVIEACTKIAELRNQAASLRGE